jgi:hypothetical protein
MSMTPRIRLPLGALALMAATGCGSGTQDGAFTDAAKIDTLLGVRLGMLMPELHARMNELGAPIDCDIREERTYCGTDLYAPARLYATLEQGRVVSMYRELGDEWMGVPLDVLLDEMRALGRPFYVERDTLSWPDPPGYVEQQMVHWVSRDRTVHRTLKCRMDRTAEACEAIVERATPEAMRLMQAGKR